MEQVLYSLPDGWKYQKLKTLIKMHYGKALKAADRIEGEVPVYGSNGVVGSHNEHLWDQPTVVIGRKGSVGEANLAFTPSWTIDTAYYVEIIDHEVLNLMYFYYFADRFDVSSISQKGVKPGINRNDYLNLSFPLPPINEQERIVEKLDALLTRIDTAIEHLQESVTLADALYASSLDQVFEKVYLDYPTQPLSALASKIGSGATPKGGQKAYKESGISLIRSLNVYDSEFKPEGLAFIDDDQAEKLSNVVVEEGDVLLNITGASIARCCVAPVEFLPARVNQHVCIIRPNEELNSTYLNYLLISPKFKAALLFQGAGGATRQALTKVMVSDLDIPLPPLEKQTELVSKVNRLSQKNRALKEQVNSKISDLITLKSSILDSAFKGEL